MICVEGYKAFHGTMKITPVNGSAPLLLRGDWLYKPECGCWYGGGQSFGAEICQVARDEHQGDAV